MAIVTTRAEIRAFAQDKQYNPSGLPPADVVATTGSGWDTSIDWQAQPDDHPFLALYGVVLLPGGEPGGGFVSAMTRWRREQTRPADAASRSAT